MATPSLEAKSLPLIKGQASVTPLTSLAAQLDGKAPPVLGESTAPAPASKGVRSTQTIPEAPVLAKKLSKTDMEKLRIQRLESLLEKGRRGIRSYLWIDYLKKSLAFSYSLDKGKVAFTDELAEDIAKALGLPVGWLDEDNAPITLAAPWVFDKTLDFPALDGGPFAQTQATVSTTLPSPLKKISQLMPLPKPGVGKTQVAQAVAPEVPQPLPFSAEQKQKEQIAVPAVIVVQPVLRAVIQAPAEVRAPAMAAPSPTPAPLSIPVAVAPIAANEQGPSHPSFVDVPAGELGPLARVLLHTIELQARQGKLTEKQALEIIYKIS